jgi:hypothetical protein
LNTTAKRIEPDRDVETRDITLKFGAGGPLPRSRLCN